MEIAPSLLLRLYSLLLRLHGFGQGLCGLAVRALELPGLKQLWQQRWWYCNRTQGCSDSL